MGEREKSKAEPVESEARQAERARNEALRIAFEVAAGESRSRVSDEIETGGRASGTTSDAPANGLSPLDAAVVALLRGEGGDDGIERVESLLETSPPKRSAGHDRGRAGERAASGALSSVWTPAASASIPSGTDAPAGADGGLADRAHGEASPAAETPARLERRLRDAAARAETTHADLLELLLRFDEARGWRSTGAKHCAAWMNSELGICTGLAWEKLRVARVLRDRPVPRRLYRSGKLGRSKVRALARVVDEGNETALCAMALDATAAEVARTCEGLRTGRLPIDIDDEIAAARQRFLGRTGGWHELADGSVALRFVLPPDMAANATGALHAMEDRLYREGVAIGESPAPTESVAPAFADAVAAAIAQPSPAQRRADAFVMLVEQGLSGDERDVTSGDRYQIHVTVDSDVLEEPAPVVHADVRTDASDPAPSTAPSMAFGWTRAPSPDRPPIGGPALPGADIVPLPLPARLMLQGTGGVTASAVRRMLCDGSLVTTVVQAGEPIWIGRKSRVWPEPMRRAAIARDGHCRFPSCMQTRWLDVHHIVPWWLGGETSLRNAICLCRHHHGLIHDGGWVIERCEGEVPTSDGWQLLEGASTRTKAMARRLGMHPVSVRFRRSRADEGTVVGMVAGTGPGGGGACCAGHRTSERDGSKLPDRAGTEFHSTRVEREAASDTVANVTGTPQEVRGSRGRCPKVRGFGHPHARSSNRGLGPSR